MVNIPDVGDIVTFVSPTRQPIKALVTAVHGDRSIEQRAGRIGLWRAECEASGKDKEYGYDEAYWQAQLDAPLAIPSVNVVFVTPDDSKTDSYGRQIDRATSVPHRGSQPASGYYYE